MGVDTEVEILVSGHWITGSFLDIFGDLVTQGVHDLAAIG